MKRRIPFLRFRLARVLATLSSLGFLLALASEAQTIDDPEILEALKLERSLVEPGAKAEYLFHRLEMTEAEKSVAFRLRVFEDGALDPLDLHLPEGSKIKNGSYKIISADGSYEAFEEIKTKTIIENRRSELEYRKVGVDLAEVKAGQIVDMEFEFTCREAQTFGLFVLAKDFPVRDLTAFHSPKGEAGFNSFNLPEDANIKANSNGVRFDLKNVQAARLEPFQPTEVAIYPAFILWKGSSVAYKKKRFWADVSADLYARHSKYHAGLEGSMKGLFAEIVGDEADPMEQLKKVYAYCQNQLEHTQYRFGKYGFGEIPGLPGSETAPVIADKGKGNPWQIRFVFAALARLCGYEAELALLPDRRLVDFSPEGNLPAALQSQVVAVKAGDRWMALDPSNPYLPFGKMELWRSGAQGLLLEAKPKTPTWISTPALEPSENLTKRTGAFSVDTKGNLNGAVTLELQGEAARQLRSTLHKASDRDWESAIKSLVFGGSSIRATLKELSIANKESIEEPLIATFEVSIRGYAKASGATLELQPNVFFKNGTAILQQEERRFNIHLEAPKQELDTVRIVLPDGYQLASGAPPKPLDAEGVLKYATVLSIEKSSNTLVSKRTFTLEQGAFPAKAFPVVKNIFNAINSADGTLLVFSKP